MEILEQLETRVNEMIAKIELLKTENIRLQNEISDLAREKIVLEEENHKLQVSAEREKGLRQEALARVEALLRHIQEHDGAG